INSLKSGFLRSLKRDEKLIFDAFMSILHDKYFVEEIEDIIAHQRCRAEYAVNVCMQSYADAIESTGNEYAKQSTYDFKDLGMRIIKNISGKDKLSKILENIRDNSIVAVSQLNLYTAALVGQKKISGIVAKTGGGYLSHPAIILRSLEIPVISSIDIDELKKFSGLFSIIDADNGLLIVNPEDSVVSKFKNLSLKSSERNKTNNGFKSCATSDGHSISLSINIGSRDDLDEIKKGNYPSIGLVRTEVLFVGKDIAPGEEEQFKTYHEIASLMNPRPVVFRTADIGGDKDFEFYSPLPSFMRKSARGIKYSLSDKELFLSQLRSILRAGNLGNISIAFPHVESVDEIEEAGELIISARKSLVKNGQELPGSIKTGAFIESLQGVSNLDRILKAVDFISIGTNDLLIQYTGTSRKDFFSYPDCFLHPDFLKIIKSIADKAHEFRKPVMVCGEMASSFPAVVLLIGMGLKEFSVPCSKYEELCNAIGTLSLSYARQIAREAFLLSSSEQVYKLLRERG
ncbi:MAG TPA: putative PEP-binding protein, partial [Clostridia bacterium]